MFTIKMKRLPCDENDHIDDDDDDEGEDDKETLCGIANYKPSWLQSFANIQTFTICYSGVSLFTQTLSSYMSSQIPNIEKQFGLSSTETGALLSFNDIGFIFCSFFVSSLARFVHIPRFLFCCTVLFGISGVVCSLPHFLETYNSADYLGSVDTATEYVSNLTDVEQNSSLFLCNENSSKVSNSSKCDQEMFRAVTSDFKTTAFAIIAIGLMLQGFAKAPRTPFVSVYIDDNVEKRKTGFYTGIIMVMAEFSPALAYGLGGYFSTLFVTLEDVNITPKDPRFIGAWWLGFLVFGICALIIAVPIVFFPRNLKWTRKKYKEYYNEPRSQEIFITTRQKIKDRVLSYWRVLKNPVYQCILIANTFIVFGESGYVVFMTKYVKTQFGTTLWEANIVLAVIHLSTTGVFFGGVLTRKVKMIPRNTFGLILTMYVVEDVCMFFGMFVGCDQPNVVGPENVHGSASLPLSNCSISCGCNPEHYFPICGTDGITYHSPCYAGCAEILNDGANYGSCSCVAGGKAVAGSCGTNCKSLYVWASVAFLCVFAAATRALLSFIATIRCVEDKDKSTAIGLQSFVVAAIVYIPSPIVYGNILDTTCFVWQSGCSEEGSCLLHNIVDFRIKFHGATLLFFLIATSSTLFVLLKTRKWSSWKQIK